MSAMLWEHPIKTPGTTVSCEHCPAVQRLERALEQLQADFRREVGYWKSQHAIATPRRNWLILRKPLRGRVRRRFTGRPAEAETTKDVAAGLWRDGYLLSPGSGSPSPLSFLGSFSDFLASGLAAASFFSAFSVFWALSASGASGNLIFTLLAWTMFG